LLSTFPEEREERGRGKERRQERKRSDGSQPKRRDDLDVLNADMYRESAPLDERFPTVSELAVERSAKKKERSLSEREKGRRDSGSKQKGRESESERPDLPLVRMDPRVS